jgi:hypothetical protein
MTESSNANLTGLERSRKTIDLTFQSAKMGATAVEISSDKKPSS